MYKQPIIYQDIPGLTNLYALLNDDPTGAANSVVDLTAQGADLQGIFYEGSITDIEALSLEDGRYIFCVMAGDSGSPSNTHSQYGTGELYIKSGSPVTKEEYVLDQISPYDKTFTRSVGLIMDALLGISEGAGSGTETVNKLDSTGVSFVVQVDRSGNRATVQIN